MNRSRVGLLLSLLALTALAGCASGSTCSAGTVLCNGTCVAVQTDDRNCGTCANACGANRTCSLGACVLGCPQGPLACSDSCVDPLTSASHCGATGDCTGSRAGVACGAGLSCQAGTCVHTGAPVLTAIAVTPSPVPALTTGGTSQLTVTGSYDSGPSQDLTASAVFSASPAGVVTVSATGLVTAVAAGSATLTATVTPAGGTAVRGTTTVTVTAPQSGYDPGAGWTLVWSDEFDGAAVDPASWTFDLGSGGWGNGESQYYRAENAVVAGGMLTITARREPFGDAPYTSARLQTSRKHAFTYGKFSMRAKLPYSQAMWPAFWMLGANCDSWGLYGGNVSWPGCGEVDIMEMIGGLADGSGDFTTHGTLHYLDATGRNPAPSFALRNPSRLSDDFHVYEVVWTPRSFTWKLDGVAFGTKLIDADMEEFSRPMFILLNLAVGGAWGGWVDATTVFPQTYVIDYVRVYTNDSTVPGAAAGLSSNWHLSNGAATGVSPPGESLSSAAGTTSGFQPLKVLSAPATWYSPALTGSFDEGAWSAGIYTASPGTAATVRAELFVTADDGSGATRLGTAELDVNATGGGNHRSWFTFTGVPIVRLTGQRLKLVLTPVSGASVTMVYNGNDFDSLVTAPFSPR